MTLLRTVCAGDLAGSEVLQTAFKAVGDCRALYLRFVCANSHSPEHVLLPPLKLGLKRKLG